MEQTYPGAAAKALRDRLRESAVKREKSIAYSAWELALGCMVLAVATGPFIGWPLAVEMCVVLGTAALYYAVLGAVMRRGHFHPAIHWVNVAIEVSAPAVIMWLDAINHGPEYALTAATPVIWGGLVMLSGLRSRPRLAWAAGGLAAGEFLALYVFIMLPRMPAEPPLSLTPAIILVKVALLFAFGPLTALIAAHLRHAAEAALSDVRAQDLLGKYLLHERIGVGGMAEVYRATYSPEGGFEKQVAVKRVLPAYAEDMEFVDMFREEAELGSKLNHPNIVQVFDLVRRKEEIFLAMEFVDGTSLKNTLVAAGKLGQRLPIRAVTFVAAETAAALEYLHEKTGPDGQPLDLVHRDLNPPNILVSKDGDVKVADFGIARAAGRATVTQAGLVRGKAAYMAPEQAAGEELDGRVDLFALGLTMHEALTGQRTLTGDSDTELMRQSQEKEIPPASSLRNDVPRQVDALLARMLEREKDQRIASAREVREALLALPPEAAPYPHGKAELAEVVRATLVWRSAQSVEPDEVREKVTPMEDQTATATLETIETPPTTPMRARGTRRSKVGGE